MWGARVCIGEGKKGGRVGESKEGRDGKGKGEIQVASEWCKFAVLNTIGTAFNTLSRNQAVSNTKIITPNKK